MTTGSLRRCASLALLASTLPASAAKPELDALVASLAPPPAAEARFVEVRYSHLVQRPLRSEGVLRRDAGTLEKRIVKPRRERVTIGATHAEIERNGQVRRIALLRAPELAGLVSSFGALMDGDAAALDAAFESTVVREGDGWSLVLVPRDEAMRRRATIEIAGRGDAVRCVALREPDGDASVMAIGDARAAAEVPPSTAQELLRRCRYGA